MESTHLSETQSVVAHFKPVDANGFVGITTDVPSVSVDVGAVCDAAVNTGAITPSDVPVTIKAKAPGVAIITLAGLSDAGAFSHSVQATVTGGPATDFVVTFDAPFTTPTS